MRDVVHVLERRAGVVIPERKGAVVTWILDFKILANTKEREEKGRLGGKTEGKAGRTAGKEHPLGIDGKRVDDGVVPAKVEHERPFGAFPLFDIVTPS